MPSLFVIIPGFGSPNLQVKKQVLRYNLERIRSYPWSTVSVTICVYDDSDVTDMSDPDITFVREKGVVGQFIKRHAPPDVVRTFDYILILLDDVLLQPNVSFENIIKNKELLRLDIISPTLSLDSKFVYKYMLTRPDDAFDIKVTSFCELFCFFMDPAAYAVYYPHIDEVNNPWLWGLDLILWYIMGLRVGMCNHMTMKHFYYHTCYKDNPEHNPFEGFKSCMDKYGITDKMIFERVPCELYRITESFCTL